MVSVFGRPINDINFAHCLSKGSTRGNELLPGSINEMWIWCTLKPSPHGLKAGYYDLWLLRISITTMLGSFKPYMFPQIIHAYAVISMQVGQIIEQVDFVKLWQLRTLSQSPLCGVIGYSGFTNNGIMFHCKDRSMLRSFQNSVVLCKADTTCYSSISDNNPVLGEIEYYSVLRDVIELQYSYNHRVSYLYVTSTMLYH